MSFDIDLKLIEDEDIYSNSWLKANIIINNKLENEIYFEEINLEFECNCIINITHLRRFKKVSEINQDIQKIESHYSSNVSNKAIDCSSAPTYQFCIARVDKLLFQKVVLQKSDSFEEIVRLQLPEVVIGTYKSKYIQFSSELHLRLKSQNGSVEKVVPVRVCTRTKMNAAESSSRNDEAESPESSSGEMNPFELEEEDTDQDNRLLPSCMENRMSLNYKVSYKDSELCYLVINKSPIMIGEDLRLFITFVPNSGIRCLKFSLTLKAAENLLIPTDPLQERKLVTVSSVEFGPHLHDCVCLSGLPLSVRIPEQHYPTLETDVFHHTWSLHFTFLVTSALSKTTTEALEPPQTPLETKNVTWSLKLDVPSETLNWTLPIRVVNAVKSPMSRLTTAQS